MGGCVCVSGGPMKEVVPRAPKLPHNTHMHGVHCIALISEEGHLKPEGVFLLMLASAF